MGKNRVGLLVLAVLFLFAVSGCVSLSQNKSNKDLQEKVNKLEERVDRLEQGEVQSGTQINAQPKQGITGGASSAEQPTVKKEVSGIPANEDIQTALKNAGLYDGAVDGKIGPKTRSAIKEFQKQNNLEADGIVGKKTWEVLSKFYYATGEKKDDTQQVSEAQ
ncbi:MAG: peptidoglycan-binding domain-containing protein [Candidatus Omnitrophica bacterium]|nr:peptidoglycan-binding domain-containing protein [Candidatus Omnitrophota bacterium]MDD5351909.1 peptidoglycan-binding domain-containing protein [Candidatus Omnitrophota bacterium]MDD5550735.1 peptidoglycan-binding domain-containing protein [Candidatus Omnitrophota bacterium]